MPRQSPALRIRLAMLRKGVTQTSIGQTLGVTQQAVWHVIEGTRTTARIQDAIAESVGQPVEKLFPGRRADVA